MSIPYVPARWQKPRRHGSTVELIVIHTMEGGESLRSAEACAAYFAEGQRTASAHHCIDADSVVECVPLHRYAYGAGGGIGARRINDCAIHIEHAGTARQTPADWADSFSRRMLSLSALDAAIMAKPRGIRPIFRRVEDLRAGYWNGFTDHATIERAFPSTGHWDPGPHFPWVTYLEDVAALLGGGAGGDDDMAGRLIVMVPGAPPSNVGRWQYWRLNGEHVLSCNGAPALEGSAPIFGIPAAPLPAGHRPILGIEPAPDGNGVVAIADDQGTFTFRVAV